MELPLRASEPVGQFKEACLDAVVARIDFMNFLRISGQLERSCEERG